MSEPIACPDCGHRNPPASASCERCYFPLIEGVEPGTAPLPPRAGEPPAGAPPPVGASSAASAGSDPGPLPDAPASSDVAPDIRMIRPVRPRRPGARGDLSVTLWLGIGAFVALLLVLVAIQANLERHEPPVAGSNSDQQKVADALRVALERDSTDAVSRVALADILFDTGNWSEAVIHYSSAVRHDSSQVTAIVDLGVCYYNLGVPEEAERLFRLTLARNPHQPYALFNLGIVYERRGDLETALKYFHSALQATPPENMKPAVMEALQRVAKASGKEALPLDATK